MFVWGSTEKGKLGLGKKYVEMINLPTEVKFRALKKEIVEGTSIKYKDQVKWYNSKNMKIDRKKILPLRKQLLSKKYVKLPGNAKDDNYKDESEIKNNGKDDQGGKIKEKIHERIDVVACTDEHTFYRTSFGRL